MLSSLLTLVPLSSARKRAAAQRHYHYLETKRLETVGGLPRAIDRLARAVALEHAADHTDQMAALHNAAWGRDEDADGRPWAVSLTSSAELMRRAAATERAVYGAAWRHGYVPPPEHPDHSAELRLWVDLARTADPGQRGEYYRSLHLLLTEPLGDRATAILAVLADSEDRWPVDGVPAAAPAVDAPAVDSALDDGQMVPRLVIATAMALLAVVVMLPLDEWSRVVLALAVPSGVLVALALYRRVSATRPPRRSRSSR